MGCIDRNVYPQDFQERQDNYMKHGKGSQLLYQISQIQPINPELFNLYRAISVDARSSQIDFDGYLQAQSEDERSSKVDYGTENRAILTLINS